MSLLGNVTNVVVATVTFIMALIIDYFIVTGAVPIASGITDSTVRIIAMGGIVTFVIAITIVAPFMAVIADFNTE